jgi:FemAB-related protein (PEP-CTERM system-associated)
MSELNTSHLPDSRIGSRMSAPARISELSTSDESLWDAYVHAHPEGTFYHLSGWRRIFEDKLGHRAHYLMCESGGELRGVLPLVQVKSLLFGNALISCPFLVYGGPLASGDEFEKSLVERACELARELRVDYLELRNRQPLGVADSSWQRVNSHVTFRKDIDPDPQVNLQAIPRKQRAMIRKGENAGLTWRLDDDASSLYAAMLECKRNLGTPFFGRSYLQAIKDEFGEAVEVLTVNHGRSLVCSVMSFRFRDEILPYYGGGGDLARQYKGNDFMYWSVMEKACREGVRVFDYGRSQVDSGAYRFKKHWGFEPEALAYQYYLVAADSVPNMNPSNPRYRLAINMWKRLPLSVAGVLGPPIAKRLG